MIHSKEVQEQDESCNRLWFAVLHLYVKDLSVRNSAASFDLFGNSEQLRHLCKMCGLEFHNAAAKLRRLHYEESLLYTDNNQLEIDLTHDSFHG